MGNGYFKQLAAVTFSGTFVLVFGRQVSVVSERIQILTTDFKDHLEKSS